MWELATNEMFKCMEGSHPNRLAQLEPGEKGEHWHVCVSIPQLGWVMLAPPSASAIAAWQTPSGRR
jgi:hypothetical protein